MIRRETGIFYALLLCAMVTAPGLIRADTADAQANFDLTDPASGKTGTVRATATAIIAENMVIEYVSPMNLGTSGAPGKTETLRLIATGSEHGSSKGKRNAPPLTASLSVQGMPNQTFAISIDQAKRALNPRDGIVVATFIHNAGQTPHIGPAGDTEFTIGAALRVASNTASRGYNGALDVIVSHN